MSTLKVMASNIVPKPFFEEVSPRKSISDPIWLGLKYCEKYGLDPEKVSMVRILISKTISKNTDYLEYKNQLVAMYKINASGVTLSDFDKPIDIDSTDLVIRFPLTDSITEYPNGKNRNVLDDASIDYYLDVDADDDEI